MVTLGDLPRGGEPEPGAFARRLGREERFEDALAERRRDTRARVADLAHEALLPRRRW